MVGGRRLLAGGDEVQVYDSARQPPPFVEEIRDLYRYRSLVALWSVRNITLRYKRSVLGVLWTLIEPLMLMVILAVVFSTLFRFALDNYPIYILSGLLTFDFFSRSTQQMVEEIITSQNLAQRVYLPRSALAVAAICSYLMNWALALLPLLGIMLVLGHPFSWALLSVPLIMLLVALFALGVGLVVSCVGAVFHDFKLSYSVLLTAWMYATPIIYPLEIVPEKYLWLFRLNPLLHYLELFRAPIYRAEFPSLELWLGCCALSLVTAGLGWWLFARSRRVFEYYV